MFVGTVQYIHEDVEGEALGGEVGGEFAHRVHGGEVQLHKVQLRGGRLREDGLPHGPGGVDVPDGHDDVGPAHRQDARRLRADPARRPCPAPTQPNRAINSKIRKQQQRREWSGVASHR